jgi:hypothetical protein
MKILAMERELDGATAENYKVYANDEARAVWNLYKKGIVREIYFKEGENKAVIVLECTSFEEAINYLAQLPFVANKLIAFDLIPLVPYPGFERLFAES